MRKMLPWLVALAVALLIAVAAAGAEESWTQLQIKTSDNIHQTFFFDVEPVGGPELKNGPCIAKVAITVDGKLIPVVDSTAVYSTPPVKNRLPQIKISGEILLKQVPDATMDDVFEAIKKAGIIYAKIQ